MPCYECHVITDAGATKVALKCGDESIMLCQGCHPSPHFHPVNVDLPEGPPADSCNLPLGVGAFAGKIVCLTCHNLHPARHERHLLRPTTLKAGNRLMSFCGTCHGDHFEQPSPHQRRGDTCRFCHLEEPKAVEGRGAISVDIQSVCNFCHGALDNQHFRSLNPFNEEGLFINRQSKQFPLVDGRYTCITCHDPHATDTRRKMLREGYLLLAGISRKVNPHFHGVMCIACHDDGPVKGAPALKEKGNIFRLCYRCHATKYTSDYLMHPVNVIPSARIAIPQGMPLQEGRITCGTCHESCEEQRSRKTAGTQSQNPKFLRGGYSTRGEFCLRCHVEGLAGLFLKPHEQRDFQGNIALEKCLLCHSSVPENQIGWVRNEFRLDEVEINGLCLTCHSEKYQESHPKANHFVVPSDKILTMLESAEERVGLEFPLVGETIVCITCHDPHQAGIVAGAGTRVGATRRGRLRVSWEICGACHQT